MTMIEANGPKILHLDIETAPNIAHVWGLFQQNIGLNQILASGYVLCFAAKWDGGRRVFFHRVRHTRSGKVIESSRRSMLRAIHSLLGQADAAVHYNGKSFDIPTLNKEFLLAGMGPPAPYKQIDLLEVARKEFRFPSNKLDYVAKALGLQGKVRHKGHELWIQCMAGNQAAWNQMEVYNKRDVTQLEKVYHRMLGWIRYHPNFALYTDDERPRCTNCGSLSLHRRGYARTNTQIYPRYHCPRCNAWSRGAVGEMPKNKSKRMLRHDQG